MTTFVFSQNNRGIYAPVPEEVSGVSNPKVSLNGLWKFSLEPPANFWEKEINLSSWDDITVPGEIRTQGFAIKHDTEVAYRKDIKIPKDFKGQTILLRFDGVYNYARVWVNGNFVKEHYGGFTTWYCDITKWAKAGKTVTVTLGVTDREDDISMGSGYAKHVIGGIIRDVYLLALPKTYINGLKIDTDFDENYNNAELVLQLSGHFEKVKNVEVQIELFSPEGIPVKLPYDNIAISEEENPATKRITVPSPKKWDAEHPNLYTLDLNVLASGEVLEKISKKVGFREIVQSGRNLFVNGKEIKLRGADHHSTHPLKGRTVTKELEKADVLLAKEANMNFLRTSHYPPTEAFLDYCDEYGIYVEDESAVTFVDVNHHATQDDPKFADRYLGQLKEMVWAHYNHPSVLMWSIANESVYGTNFQLSYDWLKQMDKTRPVAFSYPSTVKGNTAYDIISIHYPHFDKISNSIDGLFDPKLKKRVPYVRENLPVLYDEWAHVPTYNAETIKEDPNVRNFWGHSIKAMWDQSFNENGVLGGAIWCMVDDVFLLPKTEKDSSQRISKFGTGEWGIVDAWRRKKPEFWHTRKGYSPIKILDEEFEIQETKSALKIAVQNRFDHTNFNELTIKWKVGEKSGQLQNVDVPPHSFGILGIPEQEWKQNDILELKFYKSDNWPVDEFRLNVNRKDKWRHQDKEYTGIAPELMENDTALTIDANDFKIVIDKSEGLISEGSYYGNRVIVSGPHLQLSPIELKEWALKSLNYQKREHDVLVHISGSYDSINVNYNLLIKGDGTLITEFEIENPPPPPPNGDEWWPKEGYREVGVAYVLKGSTDRSSWERKALWTVYPENHMGRIEGTAKRISKANKVVTKEKPDWEYGMDMQNIYAAKGTALPFGASNDFRGTKENIYTAHVYSSSTNSGVTVKSDGGSAVRLKATTMETDSPVKMVVNTLWDYPALGWGCYMKQAIELPKGYKETVVIKPFIRKVGNNQNN
jgi:hypothetical protein